ncbi:hypothetical protein CO115_00175 [Candidatus Falkowbacteria bacterium CG_4_9_14_3_um_filter_36_9]|uniref:Uncharacterized protein n=2 Tax=Candidatus Falkowiibacteriota TaxID=1752728 RepID=A0A1J4T5V4_9BACT|nr:MAG: hypothetical protein AUJ27_02360 [Candidatus Falkowbacteria bacterium CG1_02_37_44]PIV51516.1 MAG: hypothetical protein COS18_02630 [Candidatus Falkowbacteria bacterium CG02_land_8_20_14_3_00_36_14]PJA10966.1 MAG: hypothetical protein COX67_02230 [Candidatus Falkowbacteria bacterium CG_4_10_14_0_2_um_filter_36_22]PJB20823.1 MAG: hypothetical protein CO115_00175 [Candidatus Falkowbacteria bacterium CG_4_9_14_3_um_filter_36_9]
MKKYFFVSILLLFCISAIGIAYHGLILRNDLQKNIAKLEKSIKIAEKDTPNAILSYYEIELNNLEIKSYSLTIAINLKIQNLSDIRFVKNISAEEKKSIRQSIDDLCLTINKLLRKYQSKVILARHNFNSNNIIEVEKNIAQANMILFKLIEADDFISGELGLAVSIDQYAMNLKSFLKKLS